MSFHDANDPACSGASGAVELTIEPRAKDLGGFSVRRVLPARERRMIGPFVFFDHAGPASFPPGEGIQVRPHPHIGLATITYLFEGQMLHRDNLGYVQLIEAGAVNLMTAGRGIVHSERAGDDLHQHSRLHGIQSWMALPESEEDCDPAFVHHPADALPEIALDGVSVRVILGEAFGRRSPVLLPTPTLYLECRLPAGAELALPQAGERALYVVAGDCRVDAQPLRAGTMAVVRPDRAATLVAGSDTHAMIIGGAPLGQRHIWWNFVSSSSARIEQARADWRQQRFDPIPGETEFIPLPDF